MSKEKGHSLKRLFRYNVVIASLLCIISAWSAYQLGLINPVLANGSWVVFLTAAWNLIVAVGLSKLVYDVYESE